MVPNQLLNKQSKHLFKHSQLIGGKLHWLIVALHHRFLNGLKLLHHIITLHTDHHRCSTKLICNHHEMTLRDRLAVTETKVDESPLWSNLVRRLRFLIPLGQGLRKTKDTTMMCFCSSYKSKSERIELVQIENRTLMMCIPVKSTLEQRIKCYLVILIDSHQVKNTQILDHQSKSLIEIGLKIQHPQLKTLETQSHTLNQSWETLMKVSEWSKTLNIMLF